MFSRTSNFKVSAVSLGRRCAIRIYNGEFFEQNVMDFLGLFDRALLVFERKILRRIFGPTQKANGEWRLKTNEELEKAINNENI